MLLGAGVIAVSSLAYFDDENLPPFVIEKLPVRFEALWLGALKVHVVAALLTLPACALLVTPWLQRRLALHRWTGRVTGALVLFALVPSGSVLAFDAKGGVLGTLGFLLSGALVAGFMVRGAITARRHQLAAHRHSMWHVMAQMSVAVSSRAMLLGLEALSMDPDRAYLVALWVPVVGTALLVELLQVLSTERKPREDALHLPVGALSHLRAGR